MFVLDQPKGQASQMELVVKNVPASAEDVREVGSVSGLGRSPRGWHGNPLQYSCLENPVDRGAWQAAVPGLQRVRQDGRMHASLFVLLGKVSLTDLPPSLWGSSVPRVL